MVALASRRLFCCFVDDVTELRADQLLHRELDGVGGTRRGEKHRSVADAGGGAAEHRRGADIRKREHPEELAEAVEPLLQEPGDRLVRDVAARDARSSVGDDRLDRIIGDPAREDFPDCLFSFVRVSLIVSTAQVTDTGDSARCLSVDAEPGKLPKGSKGEAMDRPSSG
jgi:hypothetical protein